MHELVVKIFDRRGYIAEQYHQAESQENIYFTAITNNIPYGVKIDLDTLMLHFAMFGGGKWYAENFKQRFTIPREVRVIEPDLLDESDDQYFARELDRIAS